MGYFAAGEVLTASKLNSLGLPATKTGDESVTSSAVLQNDDQLLIVLNSAGTYYVDVYLFVTSAANAAGDLSVGFSFPTGTMHFGVHALDSTLASGSNGTMVTAGILSATSGSSSLSVGASTSVTLVWVHGVFTATATGTLQFMWAQAASNASATTVRAGSHMTARQVA
jgi:hypothetical protein